MVDIDMLVQAFELGLLPAPPPRQPLAVQRMMWCAHVEGRRALDAARWWRTRGSRDLRWVHFARGPQEWPGIRGRRASLVWLDELTPNDRFAITNNLLDGSLTLNQWPW